MNDIIFLSIGMFTPFPVIELTKNSGNFLSVDRNFSVKLPLGNDLKSWSVVMEFSYRAAHRKIMILTFSWT